jgi:EAL domain-containing protein (putative c-di-GMP-specific phosphodiesterase class I)
VAEDVGAASAGEQPVPTADRAEPWRRQLPAQADGSFDAQAAQGDVMLGLRAMVAGAILLVAVMIGTLSFSLVRARQADDQAEAGHRQALTAAIEALQAVAPDLSGDDPRLIRILAAASGLSELRFDDSPPDGDREAQSLLDRHGRILGWLSWNPERAATIAVSAFARSAAPIALGGVGLIALLMWHLGRLRARRAASPWRGDGMVAGAAPEMEAELEEQLSTKRELGRPLEASDLDLFYQPIVTAGGVIVGLEALPRWTDPSRGPMASGGLVPVAAEAGQDRLGELVLRRALTDAKRWPGVYVSVNLSPAQVCDRRLIDLVAAVLAETGMPASRLVLEVTEGVLIDNPAAAKSWLDELRTLGLKLALDDFGAGYSSLSCLQRLPFDKLKIDGGFVAALDHSANAGAIIQAVIALGRALNLSILVEGIETEEQRALVRLAGCDEMQGYLFGEPAPRETIDRMLAAKSAFAKSAFAKSASVKSVPVKSASVESPSAKSSALKSLAVRMPARAAIVP